MKRREEKRREEGKKMKKNKKGHKMKSKKKPIKKTGVGMKKERRTERWTDNSSDGLLVPPPSIPFPS